MPEQNAAWLVITQVFCDTEEQATRIVEEAMTKVEADAAFTIVCTLPFDDADDDGDVDIEEIEAALRMEDDGGRTGA